MTDDDALLRFTNTPPDEWKEIVFAYRQSIGVRQAAEARFAKAQRELSEAQAALIRAQGYEKGLYDVTVIAMKRASESP